MDPGWDQMNSSGKKSQKNSGSNKGSKKKLVTRPSLNICEERLACKGDRPEAKYKCDECKTNQCEVCEELLHENPRFDFHDRTLIEPSPPELICQSHCEDRNFADLYCNDCQLRLCSACDQTIHSQPSSKKHSKQVISSWTQANESVRDQQLLASGDHQLNNGYTQGRDPSPRDENLDLQPLPDIAQMSLETASMDFRTATFDDLSEATSSTEEGRVNDQIKRSFLLLDEFERLQIASSDEFAQKLGCDPDALVKVVSIFGNTGEGKSHTLNYTFFGGREVFKTSPAQSSCTIGIWTSYDPVLKIITVDTEGLLGISENNNRRTRLLLKVLAISDVIIYRTRAERLHNDLFTFLGDASRAYVHHFSSELRAASQRSGLAYSVSDLGPVVIIFHETLYTEVLRADENCSPEDELRRRFQTLNLSTEAFSAFEYVGTRTLNPPTSFKSLQETLKRHLQNSTVRSCRAIYIIYGALKHLNEKFNGDIEKSVPSTFPDEYFTCSMQCLSCNARCSNSMNHQTDGSGHKTSAKCVYQYQYNNKVYHCRQCHDRGNEVLVVPKTSECNDSTWVGLAKYAWSGYVLECDRCGVIYRSRKHWYGNSDPFECVREEIEHVWPGENGLGKGTQNAAQRVLDGFQYIAETATSVSAAPTRRLGSWVADHIRPGYWRPNAEITECHKCEKEFAELDVKHHCRSCGEGFCEDCSSKKHEVPEKGWMEPVRVCDPCFSKLTGDLERSYTSDFGAPVPPQEVTARKVGEVVTSTIGNVASAIDIPFNWIKDSARPEYWVPDKDIIACYCCESKFTEKLPIHHCRACGNGVCDGCSQNKQPVKNRGWDSPVRVCDTCVKKPSSV